MRCLAEEGKKVHANHSFLQLTHSALALSNQKLDSRFSSALLSSPLRTTRLIRCHQSHPDSPVSVSGCSDSSQWPFEWQNSSSAQCKLQVQNVRVQSASVGLTSTLHPAPLPPIRAQVCGITQRDDGTPQCIRLSLFGSTSCHSPSRSMSAARLVCFLTSPLFSLAFFLFLHPFHHHPPSIKHVPPSPSLLSSSPQPLYSHSNNTSLAGPFRSLSLSLSISHSPDSSSHRKSI